MYRILVGLGVYGFDRIEYQWCWSGVKAVGQVAPQLETLLLSNCTNVSVEAARALEISMPALKHLEIHGLLQERMVGSLVRDPEQLGRDILT